MRPKLYFFSIFNSSENGETKTTIENDILYDKLMIDDNKMIYFNMNDIMDDKRDEPIRL